MTCLFPPKNYNVFIVLFMTKEIYNSFWRVLSIFSISVSSVDLEYHRIIAKITEYYTFINITESIHFLCTLNSHYFVNYKSNTK